MIKKFNIDKKAIPFILFQRTSYMRFIHSLPYRVIKRIIPFSIYEKTVHLESYFRSKHVKQAYFKDMENEYNSIKEFIPNKCNKILDIGAGIAGIDAMLSSHYKHKPEVYLLDKSEMEDEVFYLFNEKGAFYNSLELAKKFLESNEVPKDKIHTLNATDDNKINCNESFNLIISLISWGFHYPISTYLKEANNKLSSGGHLIIDIRSNTNGLEEIQRVFDNIHIIEETQTRQRVLCIKGK